MAIYETGAYEVKPSAVGKVKRAIQEFLEYPQNSEPGTEMYLAWQQKSDPTRFLHLFRFHDAAARERHGESQPVKTFESVYRPELAGGEVVFTEYEMVAGKLPSEREETVDVGGILRDFYAAAINRDFANLRRYLRDDLVFVGL